jgi:2-dehydro-3-deoxygluconokinase
MVEMAALGDPGLYRQGVAGDSFNTAVYLARAGLPVHYLTRLGNDALSAAIEDFMRSEDIATDLLTRCPGRQPGLYVINNDPNGERQFSYWREHSPARELFDQPIQLEGFDLFYFTGITLAVTCSGLQNLVSLLRALRDLGLCHILLPTLEDDTALWETPDVAACRDHYRGLGIDELVIKGPDLTAYAYGDGQEWVKQANPVAAVDTTSAGDAFNAGYLASRLDKGTLAQAITAAQALAAEVVQHRGAITPRECGGDD